MAEQTLGQMIGRQPQQKPSLERSDTKDKSDPKNDSRRTLKRVQRQCE